MTLPELKKQIDKNTLNKYYVFTGEEIAIMDIYIKWIAKEYTEKRVDKVANIFNKLKSSSLSNKKVCYVISNDKDFLTNEKLQDAVFTHKNKNVIVILTYTTIDKRSKFYNGHKKEITVFDKLDEKMLSKYISREIDIMESDREYLATICNFDYSRILLECDKIKCLSNARNITNQEAFNIALDNNLIYVPPTDAIFSLVDAVCERHGPNSLYYWREANTCGEHPLVVVTNLYNTFRQMLMVQSSLNKGDIAQMTGLTGWQIKCAKDRMGKFTVPELRDNLILIQQTEEMLKSGRIDSNIAIDYLLVNII